MEARIKKAVYWDMIAENAQYSNTETGGVLLGRFCNDHWLITHNLHPGPAALHLSGCFAYDYDYVMEQAQKQVLASQQPISVIGYWHTHTSGRTVASPGDAPLDEQFAALNPNGALCGIVTNRAGFRLTLYQVELPLRYKIIKYILEE